MREIDLNRDVLEIVSTDFANLTCDQPKVSLEIRGGQTAADLVLAKLDIRGYAKRRSEVLPKTRRGASQLSPYIRHNLLTLRQVWDAVADAPYEDREKFRDELMWQEYGRHVYARIGTRLFSDLRFHIGQSDPLSIEKVWPAEMACVATVFEELIETGWLVNQTRMWLASQWSVRHGQRWQSGQEVFYQHLLDGSRAANILGWQWTAGTGTGKPYGFARWQVEKRAPQLCAKCPLSNACPIENFPEPQEPFPADEDFFLARDADVELTRGPRMTLHRRMPQEVLLTIDSLGDSDAALQAHPDLPVTFVFHEPKLHKLQLSSKRIAFYLETLQDLSSRRKLTVLLGDRDVYAHENAAAVTWAPVPSFMPITSAAAELHPWPWLAEPHGGSIKSFSAWRNKARVT